MSGNRLYVGNLPWTIDDAELERHFAGAGEVVSARVITDRDTGRSRGFGFVEMSTPEAAQEATNQLDGSELGGRPLKVRIAEDRPRGGGGGGGGYRGGGGNYR